MACVASGPTEDIAALEKKLQARRHLLDPAPHFARLSLRHDGCGGAAIRRGNAQASHSVRRNSPTFPMSPATGSPTSRRPIRPIGDSICGRRCNSTRALSTIHDQMPGIFLEVGPGRNLTTLTKSLIGDVADTAVHSSLPHASARGAGEVKSMLRSSRRVVACRRAHRLDAAVTRASGASSAFCRLTRSSGAAIGSSISSDGLPAAGGGLPLAARAPDEGVAAGGGARRLSHGDSHLAAGAIFRSGQPEFQTGRASLASVQSDREDRQTDRRGIARTRRRKITVDREGRQIQDIRATGVLRLIQTCEADLARAVQDGDEGAVESGSVCRSSISASRRRTEDPNWSKRDTAKTSTTSSTRRSC